MFLKTYYTLKPYLPVRLRYWLRGVRARRLRIQNADTWPIDRSAARPPDGWRGWPEGKKFAFVLTHDVEGPVGYDKVRALAALEERLGFRSSFHFVPEGTYTVSRELREELTHRGFEVGIHDLHHDGSLYASPESFRRQAPRINHYLRDWNARGFRAGFMFHNLDWISAYLDCEYDLSTFDTDPFEPQPEGVHTIFPFTISSPRSSACEAEPAGQSQRGLGLPYTLPQDSTLFLILGETDPRLWLEKLDWIAEHGGMALVNVHPDYLRLRPNDDPRTTYPLSHYEALLNHVNTKYSGGVWKALPGDIARWVGSSRQGQAGEGNSTHHS
ncbi:hypothetical protein [Nibricoccus sp. IMCC34717]|uniref:hypothetical protein n=1 Tax=Nibricoccus sp. IMCC34717 TaxID=3034021 RepID=UPI00384EF9CF